MNYLKAILYLIGIFMLVNENKAQNDDESDLKQKNKSAFNPDHERRIDYHNEHHKCKSDKGEFISVSAIKPSKKIKRNIDVKKIFRNGDSSESESSENRSDEIKIKKAKSRLIKRERNDNFLADSRRNIVYHEQPKKDTTRNNPGAKKTTKINRKKSKTTKRNNRKQRKTTKPKTTKKN